MFVKGSIAAIALCCLLNASTQAEERLAPEVLEELTTGTFVPLVEALRAGDVSSLKMLLHPRVYGEYRVLFEQNREYGQFLRDFYNDADFQVRDVVEIDGGYVGMLTISWPNGTSSTMALRVTKNLPTGMQVVDLTSAPY